MKTKIVMIIMAVVLYALPAVAQNMEFRSTSTMQGSGNYVAPVTAVGATSAATSYSPAKAPGGPRKIESIGGGDGGNGSGLVNPGDGDPGSPIGDAVLPLTLMALAFCGVVYYRRKKALKS